MIVLIVLLLGTMGMNVIVKMSDSEDDTPRLSAAAMAALQEFYAEQEAYESQESALENQEVGAGVQEQNGDVTSVPQMPKEDWQLSQFWYDDETANTLAEEAISVVSENGSIACVSCPTLYRAILARKPSTVRAVILEYDTRFAARFKEDFIHYDYKAPEAVPEWCRHAFDLVVADPPFLNEECLSKTVQTVKLMAKDKVIVCTGAIMEEVCARLFDARPCEFIPRHSNNLANEFRCYTNYKSQGFSVKR